MGHLTALAADAGTARDRVLAARVALTGVHRDDGAGRRRWAAPLAGGSGAGGSGGSGGGGRGGRGEA
jgi:hypothetical protein